MCRVAGIVSKQKDAGLPAKLSSMLHSLKHGGPDHEGKFIEDQLVMGHRRLSIIDLTAAGNQPMQSTTGRYVISYNGEVYNFENIRKELKREGFKFTTRSDTEVILKAFEFWGVGCFDRLEGIFAFSLYDKQKNKLYLVRDHFGIKPMYYALDERQFVFASEVKAFKAINHTWPENTDWKIFLLAFGSIPFPYTTLQNVFQIPAGSYMEFDLTSHTGDIRNYYTQNNHYHTVKEIEEALKIVKVSVQEALLKNLVSDAALGIFLSGGIDSSLLTLLADPVQKNLKTVSVNFDDASFDEYPYQKIVLEKTEHLNHTFHRVSDQMFWDQLDDFWKAMDQPTVDGINSYFISQCAKGDGLKVVLSGLGADETFGGYVSFKRIQWIKRLKPLPFKRALSGVLGRINQVFKRVMFLELDGPVGDYLFLRGIHTPDSIARILNIPEATVWDTLKKVKVDAPHFGTRDPEYTAFLESSIYMSNQLLKDIDTMSMWHGIEARVPFLDIGLQRKVNLIEPALRFKDKRPKYLLTTAFQNILPSRIVFRKKKGFTFPLEKWIKKNPARFADLVDSQPEIAQILRDFYKGNSHWSKAWVLAVVKKFHGMGNIHDTSKAQSSEGLHGLSIEQGGRSAISS